MDYRKFGDAYYVCLDRGEEIMASLLDVCAREGIRSATFSGIGGCSVAEIQVFNAEEGSFATHRFEGTLELVSILGNVIDAGEEGPSWHAHVLFALLDGEEHRTVAGHLKSATVSYTAEIELRPVLGGTIKAAFNEETGTNFWHFD